MSENVGLTSVTGVSPGTAESWIETARVPEAGGATEPADAVPAEAVGESARDRYVAPKPKALRFYVEPRHYFFRNLAGIPAGIHFDGTHDVYEQYEAPNYSYYTATLEGPVTGHVDNELSLGLIWQKSARVADPDDPNTVRYRGLGFPVTFTADFGTYHLTRYALETHVSTKQLQDMGYDITQMGAEAAIDAFYNTDPGELMGLGDAIGALINGYSPGDDVSVLPYYEDETVPYYRIGITPAIGVNDFNASRRFGINESASLGAGVYAMGYGDHHFIGFGPHVEATPLRYSQGPVRVDLVLNLGAAYYMRYVPENLFGDEIFFMPENFFVDGYGGVSLRFSTDRPMVIAKAGGKAAGKAAGASARAAGRTAQYLYDNPVDVGPLPNF